MTASDESSAVADRALATEDIVTLNGQVVARAAAFVRLAGTALVIAGAIAVAAWLWTAYRQQEAVDDVFDDLAATELDDPLDDADEAAGIVDIFGDFDVSFADRIDVLVSQIELAITGLLAVGLGLGLRMAADYSVARTGGSLTGFEPGDEV
jgi:hypothetical protein